MPNTQKDYSVGYDEGQGKTIAEIICKEIEKSLEDNKKYYDRAARGERQYAQITKYMAANKVCNEPWAGAADYFVPLTEWIIDAVWGRVLKVLFFKRPYMKALGVEASDTEKQEGVTDFVDQIHSEVVNVYENFRYYVKQMLKLPFAVLKYAWVYENDGIYEKTKVTIMQSPDGIAQEEVLPEEEDKAMMLTANGFIPAAEEERVVLNERPLNNSPKLQYVKFSDYVWAGSSKRGYKPYWEGDRCWFTIGEMRSNQMFNNEVVEKLRKKIGAEDMTLTQQVLEQRGKLFEGFHWYGRLPVNKDNVIDFIDTEAIEHEVHAIVVYEEKELLYLSKWESERIPKEERVYLRGEFEETEEFAGRSLADKLYMTQKELNTFHNTTMNNAMLAMMKILWKRKSLTGEEWERPQLRPGLILEVDMPQDVGVLDMGDIKSISWELESSFINFAERLSNISIYQTGSARTMGGQKTKGEVDRTVYEGNIGIDKFIEQCSIVLKKISQWTVDYYYNNMPEGLERRIRGEDAQLIFPTQENLEIFDQKGILPYWRSDDIAGKFDFQWDNTSLNSSEAYQIQVANDLMERYLPHPMIDGNLLATWDILRRGLEARKIKDWKNILPPKEAVVAEMQKREQEAQARQQVKQGERAVVPKAVEMAQQMGVPKEAAMQLASQGGQGQGGV